MCVITEGHFGEFKQAKRVDNGGLGNIGGCDGNLVVTFHQVKFGENCGALETSEKVMKVGQRIAVRNSLKVEAVVVAAGPARTVWLWHKMERRSPGAG